MVMQNMSFICINKQPMLIIGMLISNKLIMRTGLYTEVLPITFDIFRSHCIVQVVKILMSILFRPGKSTLACTSEDNGSALEFNLTHIM